MSRAAVSPFVGRTAALGEVEAVLAAARNGVGSLLLVTGEPGVGKSRLAREAIAYAVGYRTAWHRCAPAAAAFRPWTRLLGALAPGAAILPPTPVDREAVFDDVVDLLAVSAAETPLLLVLDDVHDADPSSLELLDHLAHQLVATRIVVLATSRDGAWSGRQPQRGALIRAGRCLPLGNLSVDDVAALLDAAGPPLAPDTLRVVAHRTGGNPLLVTELAAELRSRGGLGDPVTALAVPESVRALVAARCARLPEAGRRALAVAAALDRDGHPDVLAAVLEVPRAEAERLLDPARNEGLVVEGGTTLRHDLLRDAVLSHVPAAELQHLHARAAAALGAGGAHPAVIAHHLLHAGPDHAGPAADAAVSAGDRAVTTGAYEDAARWYGLAAGCLDRKPDAAGRRAELLLRRGELLAAAGEPGAARADFRAAAALARELGRPTLLARAALGLAGPFGFEVGLLDSEQVDLLGEARRSLAPDETALRASTAARLSVALTALSSSTERVELCEEAVALARSGGEDLVRAEALASRCDALAGPEHCRDRIRWSGEIIAAGAHRRVPELELLGRRLRLVALLETGDMVGADHEAQAFAVTAARLYQPRYSWYVPLWKAMRALAEGRIADCEAYAADVEDLGRRAGSDNAATLVGTLRWCLYTELDDRDRVTELLASIDLTAHAGVWPYVTLALVAAQTGRTGEAAARLDAVAPRLPAAPRDSEWLPMMAQVAEIVGEIGAHPVARWAYQELQPYAGLVVVEGIGAALRGPVHRHLGILAAAGADPSAAEAHIARAVEQARAIGATLLLARILRDAGRALGDPTRTTAARELYTALGCTRRATELTGETPDPAPEPGNTFRRDGEVWMVRYTGRQVRLRDSKGLRDLAVLLARPAHEVPAVELAAASTGAPTARPGDELHGLGRPGDLGEVLDAPARAAYRRRLTELADEEADADHRGDMAASAAISAEREALVAQLAAAYGLGGRVRRAGNPAERARTAVTARIRDALRRIETAHPALGAHLQRSVRTGYLCCYHPEVPTSWHM